MGKGSGWVIYAGEKGELIHYGNCGALTHDNDAKFCRPCRSKLKTG